MNELFGDTSRSDPWVSRIMWVWLVQDFKLPNINLAQLHPDALLMCPKLPSLENLNPHRPTTLTSH